MEKLCEYTGANNQDMQIARTHLRCLIQLGETQVRETNGNSCHPGRELENLERNGEPRGRRMATRGTQCTSTPSQSHVSVHGQKFFQRSGSSITSRAPFTNHVNQCRRRNCLINVVGGSRIGDGSQPCLRAKESFLNNIQYTWLRARACSTCVYYGHRHGDVGESGTRLLVDIRRLVAIHFRHEGGNWLVREIKSCLLRRVLLSLQNILISAFRPCSITNSEPLFLLSRHCLAVFGLFQQSRIKCPNH